MSDVLIMLALGVFLVGVIFIVWSVVTLGKNFLSVFVWAAKFIARLMEIGVRLTELRLTDPVPRRLLPDTRPPPAPEPIRKGPYRDDEEADLAELGRVRTDMKQLEAREEELVTKIRARNTPRSQLVTPPDQEKPS